ncbi:MAG: MBOAT family protein [Hungatella sp.]|nr:MBOAT family protein [Hungatella sp.]
MLFTSYEFIAFLILLFLLYYALPSRYQWKLLLAASYVFYFVSGWKNCLFILLTTISTYILAKKIDGLHREQAAYIKEHKKELSKEERKHYKEKIKSRQWRLLLAGLFLNFGILAVLKYTNFVIANVNSGLALFGSQRQIGFLSLILPLGISFYTFITMGYLIDVYRGKYPAEPCMGKLALFVSFFPQLIQGPINRFDQMKETLFSEHRFDSREIALGLERILWGFFKKLVIADRILTGVTTIIKQPETYNGIYVFVGMMFYALQLYADFTGGIDITIGIAQTLGIRVQENFIRPYFSKNIAEYWRRWHISLGTWFTEYIFYPVSVCQPMLKFSRFCRKHFGDYVGKRMPVYVASLAVWFTTGIWHGASWNFVVWGLLNGIIIILSQECEPLYSRFHARFRVTGKKWYSGFQVIRTVLLMSSLRMLDCYRDVPLTFRMFGDMLVHSRISQLFDGRLMTLGLTISDYIVLVIGTVILLLVSLAGRDGSVREKLAARPAPVRYALLYSLFLCVLIIGAYGVGYDSSQFIYNQF